MNVLMINSDSGSGSTGRIADDLCHALIKRGHRCLLAYGRNNAGRNPDAIRVGSQWDVLWHTLQTRLLDAQGLGSKNATRAFLKEAALFSPDVIHLHNLHGSYINIPLLFRWLKKLNKPIVWTLHDCWPLTGHCTNFTAIGCRRWETGCQSCPQRQAYPKSWLVDRSAQNMALKRRLFTSLDKLTLVPVSQWLCQQAAQSFLGGCERRVISNGVDRCIFAPTESDFRAQNGLDGKTILLGAASVWSPQKGLSMFNALSALLDETYQIILVGVTQAQKKKLSKKIMTFEHIQDPQELANVYSATDIFLNPSVEESFGLVALEALACGIPVISNSFSANPELITPSCGLVLGDVSAAAFAQAVKKLQINPFKQADCVKRASGFDKEIMLARYLDLYETLYEKAGRLNG
ncbi:glycosyltransferase [Oscillospiraceae bacterium CM]|nr:glycosyltransferase [Oscillospiraceae bacterium CM]